MAPTMEVESLTPSSIMDNNHLAGTTAAPTGDLVRTSGNGQTNRIGSLTSKAVFPEASPVFKEALNKMKTENTQNTPKKDNIQRDDKTSSPQPAGITPTSILTKLKSAFKATSSVSPHSPPNPAESTPSKTNKSTRRPASFSASDGVKLPSARRGSHLEKRVSWADEYGSNHPLYSVRLIRPRLSADNVGQATPGHSILRNTGNC